MILSSASEPASPTAPGASSSESDDLWSENECSRKSKRLDTRGFCLWGSGGKAACVRHVGHHESRMNKPRIFLGSSGKQAKLLQAITRGTRGRRRRRALDDHVQPRAVHPRPARRALAGGRFRRVRVRPGRLDHDGCVPGRSRRRRATTWCSRPGCSAVRSASGARSSSTPQGSKLPSDLLGLTSVRYDPATSPAEVRAINQKLRKAIETEGRRGPVEGLWWQLSLTVRTEKEPSAVSLLRISRDRDGGLNVNRPLLAGGRHPVGPVLERGCERAQGSGRHLLLLEGRAPSGPECPATRGHRRDKGGDHRPRHRVLDDAVGSRPRAECPNRRCLRSSRALRPPAAGRRKRGGAGRAHRAAPA